MQVIDFSKELLNAEIFPGTLWKIDSNTGDLRMILKILGALTSINKSGTLDSPNCLKGIVLKIFFREFFETFEHSLEYV